MTDNRTQRELAADGAASVSRQLDMQQAALKDHPQLVECGCYPSEADSPAYCNAPGCFDNTAARKQEQQAASGLGPVTGNDDAGAGKQTNPKDIIGSRKLLFSVLPWRVLIGVAVAFLEGALKYGRHNYRAAGVRHSVYFDALQRHILSWWEGEDIDPDSGLHHVDKAIACLFVLRDSMLHGNDTDDRPLNGVKLPDVQAQIDAIHARHDGRGMKHWTRGDE